MDDHARLHADSKLREIGTDASWLPEPEHSQDFCERNRERFEAKTFKLFCNSLVECRTRRWSPRWVRQYVGEHDLIVNGHWTLSDQQISSNASKISHEHFRIGMSTETLGATGPVSQARSHLLRAACCVHGSSAEGTQRTRVVVLTHSEFMKY